MNKKERNNSWIYLIIISVLTVGVIALISIILMGKLNINKVITNRKTNETFKKCNIKSI